MQLWRSTRSRQLTQSGSTLTKHLRGKPIQIRSRIVAREFKSGDSPDVYAGTPPLELLKAIISIAASHSPEFSLMHVDVLFACFHAKAHRPVLVKLPAEGCSGKDKGKIGLLKKSMQQASGKETGKGMCRKLGLRAGAQPKKLVPQQDRETSGLTHGDHFVVTETKASLLELEKQLESAIPIKVSIVGAGSAKDHQGAGSENTLGRDRDIVSTRSLTRGRSRRESGAREWEHSPNSNNCRCERRESSVVRLTANQQLQISCARCLFFSQDSADTTFVVNELCQRMSNPTQQSLVKLKRHARYLKRERQWGQVF